MGPLPDVLVQQSCESGAVSVAVGGPELCHALLELGGHIEGVASAACTVLRGEHAGRAWSVEVYPDADAAEQRRLTLEGIARSTHSALVRSRIRVHSVLLLEEDERLLARLMELHGQDARAVVVAGLRALQAQSPA